MSVDDVVGEAPGEYIASYNVGDNRLAVVRGRDNEPIAGRNASEYLGYCGWSFEDPPKFS
jgi:hypothetical protein